MRAEEFYSLYERAAVEAVTDLLARGLPAAVRIRTHSMRPFFREGDAAVVVPARLGDLRRGDLTLALRDGPPVVHRYMGRRGGLVLTKGDLSPSFDAPLPPERIVGRVVFVEREGRRRMLESRRWRAANRLAGALSYARGRIAEAQAALAGLPGRRLIAGETILRSEVDGSS